MFSSRHFMNSSCTLTEPNLEQDGIYASENEYAYIADVVPNNQVEITPKINQHCTMKPPGEYSCNDERFFVGSQNQQNRQNQCHPHAATDMPYYSGIPNYFELDTEIVKRGIPSHNVCCQPSTAYNHNHMIWNHGKNHGKKIATFLE